MFPVVAKDGKLVVTEKAVSDGAISTMDADGSNKQRVFIWRCVPACLVARRQAHRVSRVGRADLETPCDGRKL